MKKNKMILIISGIWLVIDQVIKIIINNNMKVFDSINIVPNFFRIYFVKNKGAAFSMFSGMNIILIVISIIAVIYTIRYIMKNEIINKIEIISIGIILGGVVGNLIDRIVYGNVIDYLSFKLFGYDFAVFNFADIGIVVGVIILLIHFLVGEKNGSKSRS